MGKENTKEKWSEKGSKLGAKIGAKIGAGIGSGAHHTKKGAQKMGKEISKHMKKATEKATVTQSVKVTNIRYRVQHEKMKALYGSSIHCIALVDAYESLLVECLEKKLVRGLETCESRIVFDSYQEDDITGANKIIHFLDRIRINLEYIKNSLKAYTDSQILLGKTDEKQAEIYGKYILSVKKIMYEDDNLKNFDWTRIKNKDRFRNFQTIDSILEKLAKLTISAKQTCTNTIDCMYANMAKFWNKRLVQINNLTGGALGFIQQQQQGQQHSQQFMQQLKGRIQQIKRKQERQATRQTKKEKQRLKKEKQALQQQKLKKRQYRIRTDAHEQQQRRIKNAKPSSGFGLLMSHVPTSSSSSSSHYYTHYN
jgi:hypothetical protein